MQIKYWDNFFFHAKQSCSSRCMTVKTGKHLKRFVHDSRCRVFTAHWAQIKQNWPWWHPSEYGVTHTHTHSNHRCLKLFDFLVNYLHWSKRNNCANWCSSTSWLKNVPKTTPSTFYDRGCAGCAMPWRSKLARLQARMFKTLPPKHVLKQTFFEGAEWLGETVSWTNCAKTGQDASKNIFQ